VITTHASIAINTLPITKSNLTTKFRSQKVAAQKSTISGSLATSAIGRREITLKFSNLLGTLSKLERILAPITNTRQRNTLCYCAPRPNEQSMTCFHHRARSQHMFAQGSDGVDQCLSLSFGTPGIRLKLSPDFLNAGHHDTNESRVGPRGQIRRRSVRRTHRRGRRMVADLSLGDARKLDTVRLALRQGDIAEASKYGRVFELMPISA
jgi:hypothetical protein